MLKHSPVRLLVKASSSYADDTINMSALTYGAIKYSNFPLSSANLHSSINNVELKSDVKLVKDSRDGLFDVKVVAKYPKIGECIYEIVFGALNKAHPLVRSAEVGNVDQLSINDAWNRLYEEAGDCLLR